MTQYQRFMTEAIMESLKSKDPSSKIGAVVVWTDGVTVVGRGFNGFPSGVEEDERIADRAQKYDLIIHAEMRALLQAGSWAEGGTLFVTSPPCVRCAVHIIEYGIKRIVTLPPSPDHKSRWGETAAKAHAIFLEAGIEYIQLGVK